VTNPKKKRWYEPHLRAGHALLELSGHLIVVIGLLVGFRITEWAMIKLWGSTEHVFFGKLKLKDVIDAADLAVLVGFLVYGSIKVVVAYVRGPHADADK
jgi:hypothetical protein